MRALEMILRARHGLRERGVVMFEQKNGLFFVVFVCFSVGVLIAVGAYKPTSDCYPFLLPFIMFARSA